MLDDDLKKYLVKNFKELIREQINIILTEKLGIIEELDDWVDKIYNFILKNEENNFIFPAAQYVDLHEKLPLIGLNIELYADITSQGLASIYNWDGNSFEATIKINKNLDIRNNLGKLRLILRHELTHIFEHYKKINKKTSELTVKKNKLYNMLSYYLSKNELKKYHDLFFLLYITFDKEINANINEFYQILKDLEIDNTSDFKDILKILDIFQARYRIEELTLEKLNYEYINDNEFKMIIQNFTKILKFGNDEKTIKYIVKNFEEKSKKIKEKLYRIIALIK